MKLRIFTKALAVLAAVALAACTHAEPGAAQSGSESSAASTAGKLPPYFSIVRPVTAPELGKSWHQGCPMSPERLSLIKLAYVGFDRQMHSGELIVDTQVASEVAEIFGQLYQQRFAIKRIKNIAEYGADDDRSMEANNTSGFNCREVTGGGGWSNHSYGRAIDINPQINPYVSAKGVVSPPNGAPYVNRAPGQVGMIYPHDSTVETFAQRGWTWGGYWESPVDYQHFEKPLNNSLSSSHTQERASGYDVLCLLLG